MTHDQILRDLAGAQPAAGLAIELDLEQVPSLEVIYKQSIKIGENIVTPKPPGFSSTHFKVA